MFASVFRSSSRGGSLKVNETTAFFGALRRGKKPQLNWGKRKSFSNVKKEHGSMSIK